MEYQWFYSFADLCMEGHPRSSLKKQEKTFSIIVGKKTAVTLSHLVGNELTHVTNADQDQLAHLCCCLIKLEFFFI
jgi:hypothetical protein